MHIEKWRLTKWAAFNIGIILTKASDTRSIENSMSGEEVLAVTSSMFAHDIEYICKSSGDTTPASGAASIVRIVGFVDEGKECDKMILLSWIRD